MQISALLISFCILAVVVDSKSSENAAVNEPISNYSATVPDRTDLLYPQGKPKQRMLLLNYIFPWFLRAPLSDGYEGDDGVFVVPKPVICLHQYTLKGAYFRKTLIGVGRDVDSIYDCMRICAQFTASDGRRCNAVNRIVSRNICELMITSEEPNCYNLACNKDSEVAYVGGCPAVEEDIRVTHCGIPEVTPFWDKPRNTNQRIVGGREAKAHSWPWTVSIQFNGRHLCGGSLINVDSQNSTNILITAAHCLLEKRPNLTVVVGAHNIQQMSDAAKRVSIASYQIHENYDSKTAYNDVAVVKLTERVAYSTNVQPVCLPPSKEPVRAGDIGVVVGWGTMADYSVNLNEVLNQVQVPAMSIDQCKQYYPNLADAAFVFCAGYATGGRDACQGDNGGPLVFQRRDGSYVLRGIVSNGRGCADAGKPGLYTHVSNFRTWIDTTISKLA